MGQFEVSTHEIGYVPVFGKVGSSDKKLGKLSVTDQVSVLWCGLSVEVANLPPISVTAD